MTVLTQRLHQKYELLGRPKGCAFLVVSAADGRCPDKSNIYFCQKLTFPPMLFFLNKCDLVDEEEILFLVEEELEIYLKI
jgi:elongation factor Tu